MACPSSSSRRGQGVDKRERWWVVGDDSEQPRICLKNCRHGARGLNSPGLRRTYPRADADSTGVSSTSSLFTSFTLSLLYGGLCWYIYTGGAQLIVESLVFAMTVPASPGLGMTGSRTCHRHLTDHARQQIYHLARALERVRFGLVCFAHWSPELQHFTLLCICKLLGK